MPSSLAALTTAARSRFAREDAVLWVFVSTPAPPFPDIVAAWQAEARLRTLSSITASRRGRPVSQQIVLRPAGQHKLPFTVRWVRPRLLWELLTAPEDVVVVQELNLATLFAVLSKRRSGRRVVALVEGDLRGRIGKTGSASWKMAFRRVVACFVDAFAANGAGAERYLVGGLGVPSDRIARGWWLAGLPDQPQPRLRPPLQDGPLLLGAGRLVPAKGFDLLIMAVARLADAGSAVRLEIAGAGSEQEELAALADRLGVGDRVRFLGQLGRCELGEAMRRCDLFVFPTLVDLIGRVVVEALSVGTPVIVSTLSGSVDEVVHDGVNGLSVDPRDPDGFAKVLGEALDPETLARLRAGALATSAELSPAAAARAIAAAVDLARAR